MYAEGPSSIIGRVSRFSIVSNFSISLARTHTQEYAHTHNNKIATLHPNTF